MEICTQPLTADLMRAELETIMEWLRDRGVDSIEVMFGVGCARHVTPWEPVKVAMTSLSKFIQKSQSEGAFGYADADLYLMAGDQFTVHLCHESDIHVISDDPELVASIRSYWLAKGWTVHEIKARA